MEVEHDDGIDLLYITVQKVDYLPSLQVPVSAMENEEGRISFAFDNLNLVNGEYQITLFAQSASGQIKSWNLGKVNVWFKEGQSETTNNYIQAPYWPLKELMASYPSPDNQGNPLISAAVAGIIGLLFLAYIRNQVELGASLAKCSFSGFLLVLSLVALMALIVSFWIGYVNLLQTMWLLAFSAPFSLFLLNRGLAATKIEHA